MKVRELIEQLLKQPLEAEVKVAYNGPVPQAVETVQSKGGEVVLVVGPQVEEQGEGT